MVKGCTLTGRLPISKTEMPSEIDMPNRRPSLILNALSNYAAMGTRILVLLFLTPYLIHKLGGEGYGIWLLVMSVVGYAGVLDLGVSAAVQRFVARYAGAGDQRAMNATLGSAMVLLTVVGIGASVLIVFQAAQIAAWFNVSDQMATSFRLTIAIAGAGIAVALPSALFRAALTGREAFLPANAITIAGQIVLAGLSVVALELGHGLPGIAVATCVATVLSSVVRYLLCKRMFPRMSFAPHHFRRSHLGALLTYGLFVLLLILGGQVRFRAYPVIIGKMIGFQAVAVFGIGMMLANQCFQALTSAYTVFVPRFSMLDASPDDRSLQGLFIRSSRAAALLTVSIFGAIIVLAPIIIRLWVGARFMPSYGVVLIVSLAYCLNRTQVMSIPLFYARGRHRVVAIVTLAEGAANVLLSILLAPLWGIYGVAVGIAAPLAIASLVFLPWYTCRVAKLSLARYFREVLIKPWCAFLIACGLGLMPPLLGRQSTQSVLLGFCLWATVMIVMLRQDIARSLKYLLAHVRPRRARTVTE